MREIFIDLSSDNYLQRPKAFGGYEGEHNETVLKVKLPKRMIGIQCSGYRFDFQTSEDEKISSPLIPVSKLDDDIISLRLIEQLTITGELFFNIAAIVLDGDTISSIAKTNGVFLYMSNSPKGKSTPIDPNGYKDELLEMVDNRIVEIGAGQTTKNNGEIFNDYENNIAGTKGFNIIGWDTTKNTYTLSSTEGLDTVAVGTQYSVIWDSNYINAGVITAVNGATVTVTTDYNINNESKNSLIVGDISTEEKVFFIVTRPDLGDISINEHQHAEGTNTQALLCSTHSEGYNTRAINKYSHTEGQDTIASGVASHAQNYHTAAKGNYSHAGGYQTIAEYPSQTVVGKFNNNKADTLYEVGNGTDEDHRSNAFEVYHDGHAEIQKQGETEDSVATKAYVDNQKDGVVNQIDNINNQIEDINNYIGNIETALESIIALQEALIGGNV